MQSNEHKSSLLNKKEFSRVAAYEKRGTSRRACITSCLINFSKTRIIIGKEIESKANGVGQCQEI